MHPSDRKEVWVNSNIARLHLQQIGLLPKAIPRKANKDIRKSRIRLPEENEIRKLLLHKVHR
jgi:hypothetical protein